MVTRLLVSFGTIAFALILRACGQTSVDVDRSAHRIAATVPDVDRSASLAAAGRGSVDSPRPIDAPRPVAYPTDETPPWLAELLHAPDPSVRIEGLNLWAQHPASSLDPLTYALVDSDESVRARAQELVEQELARR